MTQSDKEYLEKLEKENKTQWVGSGEIICTIQTSTSKNVIWKK